MRPITFEDYIRALKALGIQSGDLVLVHSDLRSFRIPEGRNTRHEILDFYYDGFMHVLGKSTGTLAVPAYFYEYARHGVPFDVEASPVSAPLGILSAFVNSKAGRMRSLNPLQSIAAVGRQAEELCGGISMAGYGMASPWHRFRKLGGKFLFLGTSLQPMTYVHHIEQQHGVPHLYTKIYPYPVLKSGVPIPGQPISSVRYLNYAIEYDLLPFQRELKRRGFLHSSTLGEGKLYLVGAEEAWQVGLELLKKNPYCFLKHPPAFIPGQIPTDGITGK